MNNVYSYADDELSVTVNALPKILHELKYLVSPDELWLTKAYLIGGMLNIKREQIRRIKAKAEDEMRTRDWLLVNGPKDAA